MNYYYDLYLNFQENNTFFYDWEKDDNIEYYKKLPLFQVSTEVFEDILNNQIMVEKNFLDLIKTKTKSNNYEYIALFSDKNSVIALEFDENGLNIDRSFLNLDDELNIIEIMYTVPTQKLIYREIKKIAYNESLRAEDRIKHVIKTEIESLNNKKEYFKLEYLFVEWFNTFPQNKESMIEIMKEKLNHTIGEKEINILNLIKLSYNVV